MSNDRSHAMEPLKLWASFIRPIIDPRRRTARRSAGSTIRHLNLVAGCHPGGRLLSTPPARFNCSPEEGGGWIWPLQDKPTGVGGPPLSTAESASPEDPGSMAMYGNWAEKPPTYAHTPVTASEVPIEEYRGGRSPRAWTEEGVASVPFCVDDF